MRGLPFYEEILYHEYLLSRERKELFPRDELLSQIKWTGVRDLLDFGMGNGYFLSSFYKHMEPEINLWGAECQESLIDYTLSLKVKEKWNGFIPFYIEKTEHPLLPDWIPAMDMIFCSCVLSTFADPALAIRGIGRSLKLEGRIVVIDWAKVEAPSGPEIGQKVSRDRMHYFVEDAGFKIIRTLETTEFVYAMEIAKDFKKREDGTHAHSYYT